jgi:hypothetical protein
MPSIDGSMNLEEVKNIGKKERPASQDAGKVSLFYLIL